MVISIESAVASLLSPLGFRRKGRTWWRSNSFAIQVVHLQRGWGEQLHINLGIYLRQLDEKESPAEHQCHVRVRLERVCPAVFFEPVRSLNASLLPSAEALEALSVHGVGWLEALSSKAGLCQFIVSSGPKIGFIHKGAKVCCDVRSDA